MPNLLPFHVAVPVKELDETRKFYSQVLGLEEGRSSDQWVDFNMYGHQFVIHLSGQESKQQHNSVDEHQVPVPHYGVVLDWSDWQKLADRLLEKSVKFVIDPYIRFEGEVGEQATMFLLDPSGNALEFKAFRDINQLFEK